MKKLTLKEFIEKAKKVHNNKYDYSLVEYKNSTTKIKMSNTWDIYAATNNTL